MSYDFMFKKAMELQNAGALHVAEEIYQKMLQAMPENSDVWNLLGLIAQSKRDYQRAQDCFFSAIKYAPAPFFMHYFNLGLNYNFLNKPKEACEALERAVTLNAGFKEGWNRLGVMKAEAGLIERGVECFCKALDIDNEFEEARANLCFYTNDLEKLFDSAEKNDGSFRANFLAGLASNDEERRIYYFLRAAAAEPDNTEALNQTAYSYEKKGEIDKALSFYNKVLNLNGYDIKAILGAADIYLKKGAFLQAEALYKKSFEIDKEISGAHLNYGILLYQQKRLSEALEEYRAAARLAPEKPEISYNLALILKETGDLEEALGLMFNAHLKNRLNETYAINIMETLQELFLKNAELALEIAQNWQKQEPDDVFANRALAAISGGKDISDDKVYAKRLFDAFATGYDETMSKLDLKIISTFKEIHGEVSGKVLDIGCGTGAAGAALKGADNQFDGVDISENMLKIARERGCYEELFLSDAASFFKTRGIKKYDLILAFDVLCYLGDLGDIFSGFGKVESWFTVEKAAPDMSGDYYLSIGGRYKHKEDYVKRELEAAGFSHISAYPLVLRKENGKDVDGILFCAKA